jgi:hypothetical protein
MIIWWLILGDYAIGEKMKSPNGRFSVIIEWPILDDFYQYQSCFCFGTCEDHHKKTGKFRGSF